ncbi:hypothetical protein VCRA2122O12_150092 [Vibrio crassostreae]|nr:hypothetical protein VCRA2110O1_150005 [Vibrio crassostreae]CAK1771952.1 hypothetical protein VCRA2110O4_150005 [Vibrio crassostreae]CAK1811297.1 hypothetical protein VCRA2114E5_170005 [Vibrio crassostreae]CAK2584630.1 hypothetical protein VCRA2110O3_160092 [Vibrio crassostreae]CAK2584873.1 hypothetical protein VCRA2110O2_160005 [Vibrio crassostreae]
MGALTLHLVYRTDTGFSTILSLAQVFKSRQVSHSYYSGQKTKMITYANVSITFFYFWL